MSHALLSPSSAHRWLNCTRAPRLEETLPNKTSPYAEEGTLAHSVCEITAKKYFKKNQAAEYNDSLKKFKTDKFWDDEMLRTAETYVEHLMKRLWSSVTNLILPLKSTSICRLTYPKRSGGATALCSVTIL